VFHKRPVGQSGDYRFIALLHVIC